MIRLAKPVVALGLLGAFALAAASPSEARSGRNAAAIGAGVAGFAAGAALGAAAANSGYYQEPYAYYGGPAYDSYAYVPRSNSYYGGDPSAYYAPSVPYSSTWMYENPRERQLRGVDY
jgi:hypothetical protein